MINEVTEKMAVEEEEADDAVLIAIAEEAPEESPELSQWLAQGYQSEVYFAAATNTTDPQINWNA